MCYAACCHVAILHLDLNKHCSQAAHLSQTLFVTDYQCCEAFRLQHVTLEVTLCQFSDEYQYNNRTRYYLAAYFQCCANTRSDHDRLYAIWISRCLEEVAAAAPHLHLPFACPCQHC